MIVPTQPANPFPGLRPFWTHEKYLFFGREAQTAEMLHRLGKTRFLAAVGPSGSGKSSLVRAGLIPELHGGTLVKAGAHWEVLVLRPGGNPVGNLAAALADSSLYEPNDDLALQLEITLGRSARGLVEAVRQARVPAGTNVLVVVDQFEEIFRFRQSRVSQREWADAFVNLLLEAARQESLPIYVMLTMRSDFLGDCAQFRGLAEAINEGSYLIPRLTRDQWRTAIEGPTRVGGAEITPRLVQRLLNDVADDPDQLPILQHALMRTWEFWSAHQTGAGPIDLVHYEAVGGMAEALSRHADEAFSELPDDTHRRIAERMFRALAEKGSENRGIRRPARMAELAAITEASAAALELTAERFRQAGRTFLMPPAEIAVAADTVIDLSHESLMRVWQRMSRWVEAEAQSARIYRRLAETARLWQQGKASLFRNPDLQIALLWRQENQPNPAWAGRYGGGLELALEFLEESRRAFEAEEAAKEAAQRRELEQTRALAEAERRRAEERTRAARRLRVLVIILAVLALCTIVAAALARKARDTAVLEQRIGYSRELSAHARSVLDINPELSVRRALQATTQSPGVLPVPAAWDMLREALTESRLRRNLGGHTRGVNDAEFSPDGRFVLTASDDETARVWELAPGTPFLSLTGQHVGPIKRAAFTTNGQLVLTAGLDTNAIVWDRSTGQIVRKLAHAPSAESESPSVVEHAAFSPDGRQVITASGHRAFVWDVETGVSRSLLGHTGLVFTAVFSPDGRRVLTASQDGSARLWDALTGRTLHVVTNHHGAINGAVFSPDGQRFATAGTDGMARIWTLAGEPVDEIRHGDAVLRVAFSADSRRIVTASLDGSAQVWTGLENSLVLRGHRGSVQDARFSPDSRFVVTASADNTALLWSVDDGTVVAEFRGHLQVVNRAAFSPDGRFVVTASGDGTSRIWETPVWRNVALRTSAQEPIRASAAAISRDGTRIAATEAATARVWNAETGQPLFPLAGQEELTWLAFAPDGQFLVAAGREGLPLQVWSVADAEPPASVPVSRTNLVRQAEFSTDSLRLLLVFDDGRAQVWDWRQSTLLATSPPSVTGPIRCAAFSPDGLRVAAASVDSSRDPSTSTVWIWDLNSGTNAASWPARTGEVRTVVFSPSGDTVLAGSGADAVLWNWRAGAGTEELQGHQELVTAVNFSPDGRFAITASGDRTVCLWSIESRRRLTSLRGHGAAVVYAAFTRAASAPASAPDILSVDANGLIIRFSGEVCVPDVDLLRLAQERLRRGAGE